MIQTGFNLHKQAVLLEYNLNRFVKLMKQDERCVWAEITVIYDRPVHLVREILQEMTSQATFSERNNWLIHMIRERYAPYENYVLSQLDHDITRSLCKDLMTLNENLRT